MRQVLVGLIVLFNFFSYAQDIALEWAKSAGNIPLQDVSYGLSVDDSGNVYTTGYYALTADLDPGVGVDEFTSNGGADIFVHKLDENGDYIWAKSIGGTLSDYGLDIETDQFGNVYVTGFYEQTVDFDPNGGVFNITAEGLQDGFILKLDSLGDLIWAKSFGGAENDGGANLTVDDLGNVYLTGFFGGTVDFDPGVGVLNLTSAGDRDIFVLKLNSAGDFVWANSVGGVEENWGAVITLDNLNNIYVAGFHRGTADFNPEGSPVILTSNGSSDAFLLKLDNDGGFIWAHSFGSSAAESARGLSVDESNNIYMGGTFGLTVDFDPGPEEHLITFGGYTDGYLLKLDEAGNFIWVKTITGTDEVTLNVLDIDRENNLYLGGVFESEVDFDPSDEVYNMEANSFWEDTYLLKLDSAGNFLWAKEYGGNDAVKPWGLDIDDSLNVYLSGFFEETIDFDPGADTLELTAPADNDDFFVLKMAPCTPTETTDSIAACGSFTWINGVEYFESTSEPTFYLSDTASCDSIVHLSLTIIPTFETTDTIVACNSYTWIDGVEYLEDTVGATVLFMSELGCDSLAILNLTILESSDGIDEIIACDSLIWTNGITYYTDNFTATDTFTNVVGCDSVVNLNLTVNYSSEGTDVQTACDSFTWIDGETYAEDNTTATHILTNAAGCDSLVTLDLTVNYSSEGTDVQSACNSYVWMDGIEYFEDNNIAIFTLTNDSGCDSIVTLDLIIYEIDLTIINEDPTVTASELDAEYQWLDCLNDFEEILAANSISFTPEFNGEYTVEITKYGCADTSECVIVSTVGIMDNLIGSIRVYPNPTYSNVSIELGSLTDVQIQLFTIGGQLVSTFNNPNQLSKVLLEMPKEKGVYLIEIKSENQITQFRIVRL